MSLCQMKSRWIIAISLLILTACAQGNPYLKQAYTADQHGQIADANRLYRQAIEATPDRPNPFIYYVKFLVPVFQEAVENLGQTIGSTNEVTELQKLISRVDALEADMQEAAEYLKAHCHCNKAEWQQAYTFFTKHHEDFLPLLEHTRKQIHKRMQKFAAAAEKSARLGLSALQQGQIDEANNYFGQALMYDKSNQLALTLKARLDALEKGRDLVAQRLLDQAEAHMKTTLATWSNDAFIRQTCQAALAGIGHKRAQANEWLKMATRAAGMRQFETAVRNLQKAEQINADLAQTVDARQKAIVILVTALEFDKSNRYAEALAAFEKAKALWPEFPQLSKWLAKTERSKLQADAVALVEAGSLALTRDEIAKAMESFAKAIEIAPSTRPVKRQIDKAKAAAQKGYIKAARDATSHRDHYLSWHYYTLCDQVKSSRTCSRSAAKAKQSFVKQLKSKADSATKQGNTIEALVYLNALEVLESLSDAEQAQLSQLATTAQSNNTLTFVATDWPGDDVLKQVRQQQWASLMDASGLRWSWADTPDGRNLGIRFLISEDSPDQVITPPQSDQAGQPGQAEQIQAPPVRTQLSLVHMNGEQEKVVAIQQVDGPPDADIDLTPAMTQMLAAFNDYLAVLFANPAPVDAVRLYYVKLDTVEPDWVKLARDLLKNQAGS